MYWLRRTRTARVVVAATSDTTPTTTAETGDLDGPERQGRFRGARLVLMLRRRPWARSTASGDCGEIGSLRQITTAPGAGLCTAMSNWGVVPHIGPGLCTTCGHVDTVRSDRGSTFLRCRLSDVDPRFSKYPTLPVVQCIGWASGSDNQAVEPRPNEPRVAE